MSSPPARLVQTAADARVQGTVEATIRPPALDSSSHRDKRKATSGSAIMFSNTATMAGNGRLSERPTWAQEIGSAIANITLATIAVRSDWLSAIGLIVAAKRLPTTTQVTKVKMNQCFVQAACHATSFCLVVPKVFSRSFGLEFVFRWLSLPTLPSYRIFRIPSIIRTIPLRIPP